MPVFTVGERVRTTQAIQDILPDAELPERLRDLPLVGEVVAMEGPGRWRVRFEDVADELVLDETVLMPMDTHPSLGPEASPNG